MHFLTCSRRLHRHGAFISTQKPSRSAIKQRPNHASFIHELLPTPLVSPMSSPMSFLSTNASSSPVGHNISAEFASKTTGIFCILKVVIQFSIPHIEFSSFSFVNAKTRLRCWILRRRYCVFSSRQEISTELVDLTVIVVKGERHRGHGPKALARNSSTRLRASMGCSGAEGVTTEGC